MPELLVVLLVIFIILAVVTPIGHGIWVLLAMIFSGRRRGNDRRRCVFCGKMTPRADDRCDWCGKQLSSPLAVELSDLEALQRQLGRFRNSGTLNDAAVEKLQDRVRRYRDRLLAPPDGRPAVAAREEILVAKVVEEPPRVKAPAEPQAALPAGLQAAPPARPRAAAPAVPSPPRKSWAEMLAGFMEERNIRWGELIGGLLIVGSSAALVLSLWETLRSIPYFPFLIFVTITAAVFGLGLYAHHRWKLASTSRGLLVIATLLVPLSFLAMAGLSKEQWSALTLVLECVSLGLFAWLVGLAGRVLVPKGHWLQVLAVLGSSAGVLLAAQLVAPAAAPWKFFIAGGLPVVCFAAAVTGYLFQLRQQKRLEPPQAVALFTLLGTAAFALVVVLGLLVARADGIASALDRLCALIALAAVPVLAVGLTVTRGTARQASLAGYHAAGTTIALVGMLAMLAALGFAWPHPLGIIAVGTLNCAALALAAFYYRLPILFAAHQAMLVITAVVATTAWLKDHAWITTIPRDWFLPWNFQAYAVTLGLLSLGWAVMRVLLRGNRVARKLLDPPWRPVDWVVRHVLVWLQLLLVGFYLLLGSGQELLPSVTGSIGTPTSEQTAAAAGWHALACVGMLKGGAWMLLGVLAAMMVVALWERWRDAELASSLLLAATVPCLIAGQFSADQAVASALRWGLSIGFVVCSIAVWQRRGLLRCCSMARARVELSASGARIARAAILATTAGPVLALTVIAALLQFAGTMPRGPAAESFFDRLGPNLSYIVPLLMVVLGLVGHAVRERSAEYAFSAGLVAELIVTLGYALSVVADPDPARRFGVPELVTLLQLATITAAAWAGAWLVVRRWLNIWREGPQAASLRSGRARVLMNVQLGIGGAGNALLIGVALGVLALFHPHGRMLTGAVGDWPGWVAMLSVAAAAVYRQIQVARRPDPNLIGLLGMTVLGLLACTIHGHGAGQWEQWGYRTLMLGWATYALFIVSATWWVATVRTLPGAQGPPQALIRAAAVWVRVAGILAVLLGLKAAFFHAPDEERLWAAAAIAVASVAGATMAVWRRREGWAFAAALGVNVAASLVVWYFRRDENFGDWWLRLAQANAIASSAVALAWLAVRRRLYQLRELSLGDSPLLAVQTALPVIGDCMLLVVPVARLVQQPSYLPHAMTRLAEVPGWLGLLLAAAAAAWYLRHVLPGHLLHVLGGLGLGAGVLVACYTAHFTEGPIRNAWLEYHTLTATWAAVGLLVLAAGMLGRNLRLAAQDDRQGVLPTVGGVSDGDRKTSQLVFPGSLVQAWVTAIGILVVGLAVIHSAGDPTSPRWAGRAVLSVSLMAGILAMWLRRPAYVYISGILLNVIGVIVWIAWDDPLTLHGLVQANVLCLALGSGVWSLLRFAHPQGVPHVVSDGRPLPLAHLAAGLAVGLLAGFVGVAVACDACDWQHIDMQRLDWIMLGAVAAAVAICLWDRLSRYALAGLYFLALSAVGMQIVALDFAPRKLGWRATCDLAGFVLVAAVLGWLLPRLRPVGRALRIPDAAERWPVEWFMQAQAALVGAAAVLAAWVSIDFAFDGVGQTEALFGLSGRMAGSPGALMLLGAAILMAWQTQPPIRRDMGHAPPMGRRANWQYAAMGLGVLLTSSLGFAGLDSTAGTPTGDAPWLYRSVYLMVSAAMMTLLSGFGLGRILPKTTDWITAGRRIMPVFGGLAVAVLLLVLVQEGFLFDLENGAPMTTWAIVIVMVAPAAMVAACLAFAVVPNWDPLRLSDRQRTVYVYVAEVLCALIGLHVWLTMPWLFTHGLVRKYWMLIAMAVAFAGAGLSELFHRRRMPVLSEPLGRTALALPLLPAIGFWFMPDPTWALGPIGRTPLLWFLVGLFYAVMAASKRSIGLAGLAILTSNTGLWVLWHQQELNFYDHPQLWLIPIALAALVAEHLDRRRLGEAQRTALHYLALSVIYISSTTEFMRGIGQSVWLPLVLIGLSVAGVLAGVLLRVRSFLYLGVTFLMVVIVRMIVYAAFEQKQIWIFWTCCILLGAAIIFLFAVFEKRRNDLLAAVERFKDWDG